MPDVGWTGVVTVVADSLQIFKRHIQRFENAKKVMDALTPMLSEFHAKVEGTTPLPMPHDGTTLCRHLSSRYTISGTEMEHMGMQLLCLLTPEPPSIQSGSGVWWSAMTGSEFACW